MWTRPRFDSCARYLRQRGNRKGARAKARAPGKEAPEVPTTEAKAMGMLQWMLIKEKGVVKLSFGDWCLCPGNFKDMSDVGSLVATNDSKDFRHGPSEA